MDYFDDFDGYDDDKWDFGDAAHGDDVSEPMLMATRQTAGCVKLGSFTPSFVPAVNPNAKRPENVHVGRGRGAARACNTAGFSLGATPPGNLENYQSPDASKHHHVSRPSAHDASKQHHVSRESAHGHQNQAHHAGAAPPTTTQTLPAPRQLPSHTHSAPTPTPTQTHPASQSPAQGTGYSNLHNPVIQGSTYVPMGLAGIGRGRGRAQVAAPIPEQNRDIEGKMKFLTLSEIGQSLLDPQDNHDSNKSVTTTSTAGSTLNTDHAMDDTYYSNAGNPGTYSSNAGNPGTYFSNAGNPGTYSSNAGNPGTYSSNAGNPGTYYSNAGYPGTSPPDPGYSEAECTRQQNPGISEAWVNTLLSNDNKKYSPHSNVPRGNEQVI